LIPRTLRPIELPRDLARDMAQVPNTVKLQSFSGSRGKRWASAHFLFAAPGVTVHGSAEAVMEAGGGGLGYELVDGQASNGGRLPCAVIDKPGASTSRIAPREPHLTRLLRWKG